MCASFSRPAKKMRERCSKTSLREFAELMTFPEFAEFPTTTDFSTHPHLLLSQISRIFWISGTARKQPEGADAQKQGWMRKKQARMRKNRISGNVRFFWISGISRILGISRISWIPRIPKISRVSWIPKFFL